MRPWIDRFKSTEMMIKQLNKECKKCRKTGVDCNGSNSDCKTSNHLDYFNNNKNMLLDEGGGVILKT